MFKGFCEWENAIWLSGDVCRFPCLHAIDEQTEIKVDSAEISLSAAGVKC